MSFNLVVMAKDPASERKWAEVLEQALHGLIDCRIDLASAPTQGDAQIYFVDGTIDRLDERLARIDRRGRAVFLMLRETVGIPKSLIEGRVDDVVVFPFRPLEVLSKLRHYQQILMWDEVSRLNASFSETLEQLHEDLRLAERLQQGRLPTRFPDIRGLKIANRYLAGMRSGGDHFELAESTNQEFVSMLLSDSSSYGLSSAVLSVLMRVALKLSSDELRSSSETVQRIQAELHSVLGQKDRLSLFYGVIVRKTRELRYLNLGGALAYYAPAGMRFAELEIQGGPVVQGTDLSSLGESILVMDPGARLALISDGVSETIGGREKVLKILNECRDKEPTELVNELTYRVKSTQTELDEMPVQDCTAVIFDIGDIGSQIIPIFRGERP